MSETIRVYVNSRPVEVPASATAIDAIDAWDAGAASSVRSGERVITDSRGIVTAADTPAQNGSIFRIVRARQAVDDDDESAAL
ncbi:MAG TPA: hypothetical protein VE110_03880 [Gemmatimonadaceae bacterium]|nr:hypothetical protein [Gemmatimonadaceae bacterium]